MKRSLLICAATVMMLIGVPQVNADTVQLTLDLRNTTRLNPANGGTWQLFARKVESVGAQGDNGISGIRALLTGIDISSVVFASDIGQQGGGPYTNTLSNGTHELVYGQDISVPASVVTGVGVNAVATRDRLIASGNFLPGPRPNFGLDDSLPANGGPFASEAQFLALGVAPFCGVGNPCISAGPTTNTVVTLGDFNGSNTVTNLDIGGYVARLPGAATPLPYNPAGDFNQSGTVTNLDTGGFVAALGAPIAPAFTAVPEPSTIGLLILSAMGLIGRRSRV